MEKGDILDGKYALGRKLGTGQSSYVSVGTNIYTNQKYAIKILTKKSLKFDEILSKVMHSEVACLKKLSHPNMIQMYDFKEIAQLKKKNGITESVMYIVLELLPQGDLMDYLLSTKENFPLPICRLFLLELGSVLSFIHKAGFCHRDLKPDNILLDSQFRIKLLDFGFSSCLKGKYGNGYLDTNLGTLRYMAPEILDKKPYKGDKVDIFAMGVSLFILICRRPPFGSASSTDIIYKRIRLGETQKFWDHQKSAIKNNELFSDEAIDLINKMIAYDPNQRISFEEVLQHPWVARETATVEQRIAYFQSAVKLSLPAPVFEVVAITPKVGIYKADTSLKEVCSNEPMKQLYAYEPYITNCKCFVSNLHPNYIMRKLSDEIKLQLKATTDKMSDTKYKYKALIMGLFSKYWVTVKISLKQEKTDKTNAIYFVEFSKSNKGDAIDFTNSYNLLAGAISLLRQPVI